MAVLVVILIGSIFFSVRKIIRVFKRISAGTYYELAAIVLLGFILRRYLVIKMPQVFFDEFYHIATAENLALHHICIPLILRSFPPTPMNITHFLPPYPQGWPFLLSIFFTLTRNISYMNAVNFNYILSSLVPIPAFFAGFFLFETIRVDEKKVPSGEVAGLYVALLWALNPVLIKMTGCASGEVASTFFISLFLATLFMYYRYPTPWTLMAMMSSLALVINIRPENLIYILLPLPILYRYRGKVLKGWGILALLLLLIYAGISVSIMWAGKMDPQRAHHFMAIPRSGFTSMKENALANYINNILFLFGAGGVNPIIYTLLFFGGIYYLIVKKHHRFYGFLILGWWLFLYGIFSPFPFGDFSNLYSYDAYRFSLHIYFPLIFAGAYFAYWMEREWTDKLKLRYVVPAALIVLLGFSLYGKTSFIRKAHPNGYYFDAMQRLKEKLPQNALLIGQTPEEVLSVHYASGIPAILISKTEDVKKLNPKGKTLFIFLQKEPSDLLLRFFQMDIYSRHRLGAKEYTLLKLTKIEDKKEHSDAGTY